MSTWILAVNAVCLVVLLAVIVVVAVRLARMEAQVAKFMVRPFWATLQTKLAKDLTHPSPQFQEMDDLMVDLENLSITPERRARLREMLVERSTSQDPEVTDSERSSARMMLEAMDKVLEEAASDAPLSDVQQVGHKTAEPKDG